jgi:predicted ATPase
VSSLQHRHIGPAALYAKRNTQPEPCPGCHSFLRRAQGEKGVSSACRASKAKLWELRAAVSLARLRCGQGRSAEARDLLAPVYGWFTEGFDTPELKDAKAQLDERA